MRRIAKVVAVKKTPQKTDWFVEWGSMKRGEKRIGPFQLERDACRRLVDMIDVSALLEPDEWFRVGPWLEWAERVCKPDDLPKISMVAAAARAARDAAILHLAGGEWDRERVTDALLHAGQWLAPIIGTDQDVLDHGNVLQLDAADSPHGLVCDLDARTVHFV